MEKTLKQDEIDALFQAAQSRTAPTEAGPNRGARQGRVIPTTSPPVWARFRPNSCRAISMLNDLVRAQPDAQPVRRISAHPISRSTWFQPNRFSSMSFC